MRHNNSIRLVRSTSFNQKMWHCHTCGEAFSSLRERQLHNLDCYVRLRCDCGVVFRNEVFYRAHKEKCTPLRSENPQVSVQRPMDQPNRGSICIWCNHVSLTHNELLKHFDTHKKK
jgi:hypothetical protein